MDWKPWLYGLVHSLISGGVSSVAVIIADPSNFNLSNMKGAERLGSVFATGAIIGVVLYLKQSPLPPDPKLTVTTTTTVVDTTPEPKAPGA